MFNIEQLMSRTAGVIVRVRLCLWGGETHTVSSVRRVYARGGGGGLVSTLGKCKHGGVFGWSLAFRGSGKWHLVTAKTNKSWVCACVRDACASARAHAGERAAAKCHCVAAKTNRLNEKQLLGQRARKWVRERVRDGGDPGQAKHTDPAVSLTWTLRVHCSLLSYSTNHHLHQPHPSHSSTLLPVPDPHPSIHCWGVRVKGVIGEEGGGEGVYELSDGN